MRIKLNKKLFIVFICILFSAISVSFKQGAKVNRQITKQDLLGTWKLISEDQCDSCEPMKAIENKFLIFSSDASCEGVLFSQEKFQKGEWTLEKNLLTISIVETENINSSMKYTVQFYDNKLYLTYQAYYGSANRIFILNTKTQ